MHPEILEAAQRNILPSLSVFSSKFGLVGGTAIAYIIGHRRSVDFDLFSVSPFDNTAITSKLRSFAPIERVFVDELDQYEALVGGVRITFLRYPYALDFSESFESTLRMPNLQTLGAMKLFALGRRAKWKDYVDLYFILRDHSSLADIMIKAREMFGNEFNEKILREQLAYFDDIDYSESVSYLPGFETPDETIRDFLIKASIA